MVIIWPSGIIGPDDVGVSGCQRNRKIVEGTHNLTPNGGILMHDVRDLARVLSRCLTAKQGPEDTEVGHYLDWPETEIFLESVTGKRLRTITFRILFFTLLGDSDLIGNLGIDSLDLATSKFMTSLTLMVLMSEQDQI